MRRVALIKSRYGMSGCGYEGFMLREGSASQNSWARQPSLVAKFLRYGFTQKKPSRVHDAARRRGRRCCRSRQPARTWGVLSVVQAQA
jgi:hypothetical protein